MPYEVTRGSDLEDGIATENSSLQQEDDPTMIEDDGDLDASERYQLELGNVQRKLHEVSEEDLGVQPPVCEEESIYGMQEVRIADL